MGLWIDSKPREYERVHHVAAKTPKAYAEDGMISAGACRTVSDRYHLLGVWVLTVRKTAITDKLFRQARGNKIWNVCKYKKHKNWPYDLCDLRDCVWFLTSSIKCNQVWYQAVDSMTTSPIFCISSHLYPWNDRKMGDRRGVINTNIRRSHIVLKSYKSMKKMIERPSNIQVIKTNNNKVKHIHSSKLVFTLFPFFTILICESYRLFTTYRLRILFIPFLPLISFP